MIRRGFVAVGCLVLALACGGDSDDVGAFTTNGTGEGDGDADAPGDGDGSDNDNGDGDGDGEAESNGDGDGEAESNDNGDGDGEAESNDNGDGDGEAEGNGDGDGDPSGCSKADILFVIDNSGSMLEEQTKLTQSFPGFITDLEALAPQLDYHIMVIDVDAWVYEQCELLCQFQPFPDVCVGYQCGFTTPAACEDVLGAGVIHPKGHNASNMNCNFAGGGRYMTSDQPNPAAAFSCAARVGTDSTDDPERPMEAMSQAVASVGQAATCNSGFLRDDAILIVVFVTDENDDVGDGSAGTVADWRQALIDAKQGNEAAIGVVGVFGDNDIQGGICGPLGMESGAEEAPRLREFVESWGQQGRFSSICAPSYATMYESAISLIDVTCESL
ncbi:MAG TPA: hypothetical protein VM869_10020 [Enhygromyxa sp.]|nr:hypothetical protein [Enhygromyxa sp.]